jgi:hypothetical protein
MPQPETIKKTSQQIARFNRNKEIRETLRGLSAYIESEFLNRERMRKRRNRTVVQKERTT